jgi:putative membrane protein
MSAPGTPDRPTGAPDTTSPGEEEPDYRFTLANERTFLSWMRTSLALLAAGVAIVQLVPAFSVPAARGVTGSLLAVLAVLTSVSGVLRWRSVDAAVRRGRPLPAQRVPWVLAAGLFVLALFGLVLIVLQAKS